MKTFLIINLLFISMFAAAQKPIEIKVWANGAPNDNGIVKDGKPDEATLYVFPAAKSNGMAIVACPGGAYAMLAMGHEGLDMANWFNAQGITYAVLKYRMPNGHNEVPLSDAHQAIRIMRQHAGECLRECVDVDERSAQRGDLERVQIQIGLELVEDRSRHRGSLEIRRCVKKQHRQEQEHGASAFQKRAEKVGHGFRCLSRCICVS